MNPFVLQVSRNPLPNFSPKVVVVGAMICVESEFLLLERCASVSQPLTWSLPAGKVEAGESLEEGLRRELLEETGLDFPATLPHIGSIYVRLQEHFDYVFHIYGTRLESRPAIQLAPDEHSRYRWVTVDEARKLPLIGGGQEVMDICEEALLNGPLTR